MLTDDPERAGQIAAELDSANSERRATEREALTEAERQLAEHDPEAPAIVLAGSGWHPGVIGIVASRIVDRRWRPTIMIALDGDSGKGSGRSIPGFDLVEALGACAGRLGRFGGHAAAAGLSIEAGEVDAFRRDFIAAARKRLEPEQLVRVSAPTRSWGSGATASASSSPKSSRSWRRSALAIPSRGCWCRRRGSRTCARSGSRATMRASRSRAALGAPRASPSGSARRLEKIEGPVDLSVKLEIDRWNGAIEPRLVVEDFEPLTAAKDAAEPATLRRRGMVGSLQRRARRAVRQLARSRAARGDRRRPRCRRPRGSRPPRLGDRRRDRRARLERGAGARRLRRCSAPPRAGRGAADPRRSGAGPPRSSPPARPAKTPAPPSSAQPHPAAWRSRIGRDRRTTLRSHGASSTSSQSSRRRSPTSTACSSGAAVGDHGADVAPSALASCTSAGARPSSSSPPASSPGSATPVATRAPSTRRSRIVASSAVRRFWRASPGRAAIRARPRSQPEPCGCSARPGSAPGRQTAPAASCGSYPRRTTDLRSSQAFRAYEARHEEGKQFLRRKDNRSRSRRRRNRPRARRPHRVGEAPAETPTPRADEITAEAHRRAARAARATCSRSIEEHYADASEPTTARQIERAFAFACESHAGQVRKSGEDFITHPLGVARICAGHAARHDDALRGAAPRHGRGHQRQPRRGRDRFGEEIAQLVDGVTKLTEITFQSRDERQAENYRKMMVAMASDVRVILIKLADRLHNMRTLDALPKQKQMEKARETLEIFAPLAHRLGIHAIKWELEDLAFATLHPRKYEEIKELVAQQRAERERYVTDAGEFLSKRAEEGRDRGRDLRPRQALLFDLHEDDPQGARVQRDLRPDRDAGDRRLGQGLLRRDRDHPLALEAAARALQGLRRDAQGEHVPGAAHHGDRARGPAARDPDPHAGHARARRVRDRRPRHLQGGRRPASVDPRRRR